MIELLLALSLLSLITLTAASWTQIAAHATSGPLDSARWRAAARTVLQRIAEDLAVGDFNLVDDRGSGSGQEQVTRIAVHDGVLEIRTRDVAASVTGQRVGPAKHVYRFERSAGRLELLVQSDSGDVVRPLLDGVEGFECNVNETRSRFQVTINSKDKLAVTRTYSFQ